MSQFNTEVIPAEIATQNIADRAAQLAANIIHIGYGRNYADGAYVEAARECINDIEIFLAIIRDALPAEQVSA